jgi:hypothetical protein
MAYTPPNTFNPGDVIASTGLNGNLKTLQDYHNTGIAIGDIQNLPADPATIDTNSVMPGRYSSVSGTMDFVSGFQGGKVKTVPTDMYTYLTRSNTTRDISDGSGTAILPSGAMYSRQWSFLNNGSVKLSLPRTPSVIMISWFGYNIHAENSGDFPDNSVVELVLTQTKPGADDTYPMGTLAGGEPTTSGRWAPSISWTNEEQLEGVTGFPSSTKKAVRLPSSGFLLLNSNLAPGVWRAALVGQTNAAKVRWLHWTLSVEAWI